MIYDCLVLLFCSKLNFSLNSRSMGEHLLGLFETCVQVELDRARLSTKCRSCRSLCLKLDLFSLIPTEMGCSSQVVEVETPSLT